MGSFCRLFKRSFRAFDRPASEVYTSRMMKTSAIALLLALSAALAACSPSSSKTSATAAPASAPKPTTGDGTPSKPGAPTTNPGAQNPKPSDPAQPTQPAPLAPPTYFVCSSELDRSNVTLISSASTELTQAIHLALPLENYIVENLEAIRVQKASKPEKVRFAVTANVRIPNAAKPDDFGVPVYEFIFESDITTRTTKVLSYGLALKAGLETEALPGYLRKTPLSPNGAYAVVKAGAKTQLLDLATLKIAGEWASTVTRASWLSDSALALSEKTSKGTKISVWKIEAGKAPAKSFETADGAEIRTAVALLDQGLVTVSGADNAQLQVWSAQSKLVSQTTLKGRVAGEPRAVGAVDLEVPLVRNENGQATVSLWTLSTGTEKKLTTAKAAPSQVLLKDETLFALTPGPVWTRLSASKKGGAAVNLTRSDCTDFDWMELK